MFPFTVSHQQGWVVTDYEQSMFLNDIKEKQKIKVSQVLHDACAHWEFELRVFVGIPGFNCILF